MDVLVSVNWFLSRCPMLSSSRFLRIRSIASCITITTTTTSKRKHSSHQEYCMQLVKKADYYQYLCTLHLPPKQRRFAFALRALNVEVSRVRDRSRTRDKAALRYQYWLDCLNKFSQVSHLTTTSPVESEVCWVLENFNVSHHWLSTLVNSRVKYSGINQFSSCRDLESYADESNSSIYYLLAESFGIKSLQLDHALSHMGKAQGVLTHIRSLAPIAYRDGVLPIPTELLVKHNVSTEVLLRLCVTSSSIQGQLEDDKALHSLQDVCFDLASLAYLHAKKASSCSRELIVKKPSNVSSIYVTKLMLPLVPICSLLTRLSDNCDFDFRNKFLFAQDGLMPMRIAWCNFRGQIRIPSISDRSRPWNI